MKKKSAWKFYQIGLKIFLNTIKNSSKRKKWKRGFSLSLELSLPIDILHVVERSSSELRKKGKSEKDFEKETESESERAMEIELEPRVKALPYKVKATSRESPSQKAAHVLEADLRSHWSTATNTKEWILLELDVPCLTLSFFNSTLINGF